MSLVRIPISTDLATGEPHAKASGPGGRVIPPSRRFRRSEGDGAQSLSTLAAGQAAVVVHVDSPDPGRVVKLSSLGIMPGACVILIQKSPAVVLRIAETVIAIDREVADEIFVTCEEPS